MCHFITLVVATEDVSSLDAVMRRHGRCAQPTDNASLAKVLMAGERQFLTNRKSCDCGTIFAAKASATTELEISEAHERKIRQLQKRGWSEGKVARWLADTARAEARPGASVDSLDLWDAALTDVMKTLGLRTSGLFVHLYSGSIADEVFVARRRDCTAGPDVSSCLAGLLEDELLMVQVA